MSLLFALGSNGSGQLGIGHKEDVSVPKQVLFESDGDGNKSTSPPSPIRRIVAGGNHTLLLCADGSLFWSGDASSGACGRTSPEQRAGPPLFRRLVLADADAEGKESPLRADLVAATWEASAVVATRSSIAVAAGGADADGITSSATSHLLTFGLGTKGELGQGELIVRAPTPAAITSSSFPPIGTTIVDLAACAGHAVAVLSNGEAWGWGSGRKGQLGEPEVAVVHAPRRIEGVGFRVARAVCGREFTCLLGGAGSGEIAVLGLDKWGVRSGAPADVKGWVDVGAGWGNVHVLLMKEAGGEEDGRLLSWGRDDHGQIAPQDLPRINRIAVGSEHALALTADGDVVAWGWGEHGNCGPVSSGAGAKQAKATRNIIASSKHIPPGSKITGIWAGCATSWISIETPS